MMNEQRLYDFLSNLIVKHGITDMHRIIRLAYRKALELNLDKTFGGSKKTIIEIIKMINNLKEEVRLAGERFDKVTLKDVMIRKRKLYAKNL